MNDRPTRRFSQAIAEGDGISVVARVVAAADAAAAARAGADALVVEAAELAATRAACDLPLLVEHENADGADAYVLRPEGSDEDIARRYYDIVDRGDECVVQVHDDEELERALELLDPEILLLVGSAENGERLDHVLELLPDVPAGKLVIADAGSRRGDEVAGLERVGVDAVIVAAVDVALLVGDEPPSV